VAVAPAGLYTVLRADGAPQRPVPIVLLPQSDGMSSSLTEVRPALARRVEVTKDTLLVDLMDGRSLTVPLAWYPRLALGTPGERSRWRLIGQGEGIHWPDLDEDISLEGLLAGLPSGEGRSSPRKWLKSREQSVEKPARRTARRKTRRRP
jgi:hypothetical protein